MTILTHETFCRLHPGMDDVIRLNPTFTSYRRTNETVTPPLLIEYYTRLPNGTWRDDTEIERARQELVAAQEALHCIK